MIEIDKRLHQEIKDYCKFNGLIMKDFVNKLLKRAFTIEKYGETPFCNDNSPKPIINETLEMNNEVENHVVTSIESPIVDVASSIDEEVKIEKEEVKVVRTKKRKLS